VVSAAEKHILGLQIAVDDARIPQTLHSLEQLLCEHSDQRHRHTPEGVLLQDIIQVHTKKFESNAKVLAEDEEVIHAHYPFLVITVELLIQHLQDVDLHQGLVKIRRLVLNDLKSDMMVLTTICGIALQYLSECSMTKLL